MIRFGEKGFGVGGQFGRDGSDREGEVSFLGAEEAKVVSPVIWRVSQSYPI